MIADFSKKICVLGGCGTIGRVIVNCLLQHNRNIKITVADRKTPLALLPSQIQFAKVDLQHHSQLVRLLRKHTLVINSTSHHFNLPVMFAALEAGAHYLDLGGLFYFTRRQLKLDKAFHEKNLTAILGIGCAPGISNLLAQWAAEGMSSVDEIHIKEGSKSWGEISETLPYAIQTIREELTLKPAIYHQGRWSYKKPRSGMEYFKFPKPVGRQKVFCTLHSEIATLPLSFPELREATFKIGFPDEMIQEVLVPHRNVRPNISVKHVGDPFYDCEITMALARGHCNGVRTKHVVYCKASSSTKYTAGDLDTAWPPVIAAHMLLSGQIQRYGVFPPEKIISVDLFFKELEKVGFKFSRY